MANNTENNNIEIIDLRNIAKKIIANKKLFYKTLPIAFVVSSALILCVPRYYTSSIKLAPEIGGTGMGGTLGSIASSFGFDLSEMQTDDAISPLLYPDLMEDNGFVVGLFDIKVKDSEGEINTTYFDYLKKHQKSAWWNKAMGWFKSLFKEKDKTGKAKSETDPYLLSKPQNDIAEAIRSNIGISIDKKTGVITISTTAQDPLICKTLADSVKSHLQVFITQYRTNKARIDLDYYEKLANEAKQEYEKARKQYGIYSDANTNVTLESFRTKLNDLENDMQLKYNTYSTLITQYQAAKAKVQERTPAFTIVKGAAMPVKPAGPKRMFFVIGMCFLTFFGTAFFLVRKDLHFIF